MRMKLTKTAVGDLPATGKEYVVSDTDLPGFQVRVHADGRRTYHYRHKTKGGQWRRPKLGEWPTMTPDVARRAARDIQALVWQGHDPAGTRAAEQSAPTVADLWTEEQRRWPASKTAHARVVHESLWRLHILPVIGTRPVASVTPADVLACMEHAGPGKIVTGNRVRAALSSALNVAVDLEWCARNAATRVKPAQEPQRRSALSATELRRLGSAMTEFEQEGEPHRQAVALFRLLLLTGARRGEWLNARVADLDVEQAVLHVPQNKEGNPDKTIPLGAAALAIARDVATRARGGVWLFPGRTTGRPAYPPQWAWQEVRRRAGLPGLHIHDLRHAFASAAVGLGYSLGQIGGVLGHSEETTTATYGYLLEDPRRALAASVADAIMAQMDSNE